MKHVLLVGMLLMMILGGCSEENDENPTQVEGIRVLEPAENAVFVALITDSTDSTYCIEPALLCSVLVRVETPYEITAAATFCENAILPLSGTGSLYRGRLYGCDRVPRPETNRGVRYPHHFHIEARTLDTTYVSDEQTFFVEFR